MRQPRLLPESLDADAVDGFVSSLRTHRDRAMVWAMLLGGLRSAEVRSLRLADVDFGRKRLRARKGSKERVVPVDAVFFTELSAYLREDPVRLTRHRAHGATAGGHRRGVGRVDHPTRRLPTTAASAHRCFHRFPVHRARPPPGQTRLRNGLLAAVERSGLRGAGGKPLIVTPHQLRHTWATELPNVGMSLQALMVLLGHVTPQ